MEETYNYLIEVILDSSLYGDKVLSTMRLENVTLEYAKAYTDGIRDILDDDKKVLWDKIPKL